MSLLTSMTFGTQVHKITRHIIHFKLVLDPHGQSGRVKCFILKPEVRSKYFRYTQV
jgi:hypothetical protein